MNGWARQTWPRPGDYALALLACGAMWGYDAASSEIGQGASFVWDPSLGEGCEMADRVLISDLLVRAIIGVNPDERERRQDVLINVAMEVDTAPAAATDDLAQAVNYAAVNKRIIALVESSQYYLLETLAEAIARACLEDPRVEAVTVRVEKPYAVRYARSVGIEIRRVRNRM